MATLAPEIIGVKPGRPDRLRLFYHPQIGSLENLADIDQAVTHIKNGGIVAAQVHGVFGIWTNGIDNAALDKILAVKGETNTSRPFSTMRFSRQLAELVDLDTVHPSLQPLLRNPEQLETSIGTLVHLRVPLKDEVVERIPARLRSEQNGRQIMHNLDPSGHPVSDFISSLNDAGIEHVALTTLNTHGAPEITQLDQAIEFCERLEGQIPLLLIDPTYGNEAVKGSMVIVDATTAKVYREGFIPSDLVKLLLQVPLDDTKAIEAKYPQAAEFGVLLQYAAQHGYLPQYIAELARQLIQGKVLPIEA